MNPTTLQLVPPIIVWLWKKQHEIGGPVPEEDLARELRCLVRQLLKAQKILRGQGFEFERIIDSKTGRGLWYTGRCSLAETDDPSG